MKNIFLEELSGFSPKKVSRRPGIRKIDLLGQDTPVEPKDRRFTLDEGLNLWHSVFFVIIIFFLIAFFLAKAFTYQIIQYGSYVALADQNTLREYLRQPERGVIYDHKGNFIVRNKPAFSIDLSTNLCSLSGQDFELCKSLVDRVSEAIPLDKQRVFKELDARKSVVILSTGLTKEQILPIEANLSLYPGVTVVTAPQRDYLFKDVFSHLIGYVGIGGEAYPTIVGKMGVEESYDQHLGGLFGGKTVRVDSLGNPLRVLSEKEPIAGKNVTLFADLALQQRAYELLKEAIDEGKAEAGVIVAQDPQTGGILALVSYPSFDPGLLSGGITSKELQVLNEDPGFPFFNRAVSAAYAPGSTFKMVTASAVLSEKIVGEYYKINDPGYIQVGEYIFRNWKLDGHGEVDLRRALQVSNDVYFYTVGGGYGGVKGLGIEKLSQWANKFGYGVKTGIDIYGEVPGFIPDGTHRDWYLGDSFISAIGQGDLLSTPLQINNVTAYFGNGGYLIKPRVVKEIEGVGETEREILGRDLTDSHIFGVIREGMKMAVEPGGTGYPVFDFPQKHPGIELAGKTGTSEYIDPSGEERTHALFTVFGPYENATIALTVFLEGGGGGSDDAAPIARELLDLWFEEYSL